MEDTKNNSTVNINETDIKVFNDLFMDDNVRILGTNEDPLFILIDVANKIGDAHYSRKTCDYGEKYKIKGYALDKNGRRQNYTLLTEVGLYKYLMNSKAKSAIDFQEYVFDLLTRIRREVIQKLNTKIRRLDIKNKVIIAQNELRGEGVISMYEVKNVYIKYIKELRSYIDEMHNYLPDIIYSIGVGGSDLDYDTVFSMALRKCLFEKGSPAYTEDIIDAKLMRTLKEVSMGLTFEEMEEYINDELEKAFKNKLVNALPDGCIKRFD